MPSTRAFEIELSMNWPKVIHALRADMMPIMAEEVPLLVRGAAHDMVKIVHHNLDRLIYRAPEPPSIWFGGPNDPAEGWTDFSHPGVLIKVDPDIYSERRRDPHRLYNAVKARDEVVGPDAIAKAFIDPGDFDDYFYPKKVEMGGIGTHSPSKPIPYWRDSILEVRETFPLHGRKTGIRISARINAKFA